MKNARWSPLCKCVCLLLTAAFLAGFAPSALANAKLASTDKKPPAVFSKAAPESLADLRAIERHVKKLAERVIPATVAVQVGGAQGSGVIIDKKGHVLTAGHVYFYKPGGRVTFTLHDGRRVRGVCLGCNKNMDSGLLKITEVTDTDWTYVEMGSSKDLKRGKWCLATGHPGGYQKGRQPVVRLGRVISNAQSAVRTDCTLVGGDSGGPLFDMQGRVIGIHSRIAQSLTQNYHIPVETYRETWDRLTASEVWPGEAIIGIYGEDAEGGCRITQVDPGLPAEKAGLKRGDVITRCDGKKVGSLDDLIKILAKRKPGDEVEVEYLREEETKKTKMKLASRFRPPERRKE